MRVSITYLYAITTYGYPPSAQDDARALADIERMGFHYLEMESLGPEHGRGVWEQRHDLKRRLDNHGIHVHNFCGVDADLVALDQAPRRAAIERFRRTAELGAFLGADTLHLASYAPPVEYLDDAPYQLGADYQMAGVSRVRIPDGFDWSRVWDTLVESCRAVSAIAAEHGRTVIMEPRVGEVICSVDSMIRLLDDVAMPNFRANYDTAHFAAQRENAALGLEKLKGRYANIHIADNDPSNAEHVAIGDGVIDWDEFFRVLKLHGYDGYLGIDLNRSDDLASDLARSLERIRLVADRQGITIES